MTTTPERSTMREELKPEKVEAAKVALAALSQDLVHGRKFMDEARGIKLGSYLAWQIDDLLAYITALEALTTPKPTGTEGGEPSTAMIEAAATELHRRRLSIDYSNPASVWDVARSILTAALAEGEKPAPGGEARPGDALYGVWEAIGRDARLKLARQKLSAHEIRLIVGHARDTAPTPTAGGWKPDRAQIEDCIVAAYKAEDGIDAISERAADAILSLPSTLEGGE